MDLNFVILVLLLTVISLNILLILKFSKIKKSQNIIKDNYFKLLKKNERIYIGRSPIEKYPFDKALYNQKLFDVIQETYISTLNNELLIIFDGHDLGNSTQLLDSIRILSDRRIVMTFSKKGKKLLKMNKAEFVFDKNKNLLPVIRDKKTKRIIEQMKETPAKHINKFSKIGNLIINTAHIISAADTAKKIKIIDEKMNFLIEGRKIDKIGELEAYYRLAQQILSKEIINIGEHIALLDIHKNLMKLRSIWRQEIEYKLENIEDPKNRNFFSRKLGIAEYTKSTDKKIYETMSSFEFELALIDFSIFFDILISEKLGYKFIFEDDMKFLSRTRSLLESKSQYLTREYEEYNIDKYIEFFDKLDNRIRLFLHIYNDSTSLGNVNNEIIKQP